MPARADKHLCAAIEHQCAVGQPGEGVVRGGKGQLLLAQGELLVGVPALLIKHDTQVDERHVEADLSHCERLRNHLTGDMKLSGAVVQDLRRRIAPAQTAPYDRAQRSAIVRGESREDLGSIEVMLMAGS